MGFKASEKVFRGAIKVLKKKKKKKKKKKSRRAAPRPRLRSSRASGDFFEIIADLGCVKLVEIMCMDGAYYTKVRGDLFAPGPPYLLISDFTTLHY